MKALYWVAKFRDGEVLREQDGAHSEYDSPYHGLRCLDRPVRSLGWFDGEQLVAGLLFPSGVRPFLSRRNVINLKSGDHSIAMYLAGWESDSDNEYVAVYADGSVLSARTLEELGERV